MFNTLVPAEVKYITVIFFKNKSQLT
jgi:hypothetical protein